ncbi:MAG: DUF1648 domain-containing protein [Clostridium sp.]|uniref:DUF1648 domain-containing protein n=1 Tax=Clostridium sp. TaxID=1506 RepID=UPI0025C426FF|nr:DUF1648 domain-containing protein [Clostridium sp.]MBS4956042.1 DUF1648 domain-containing protein [Clostridium sp.]
MEKWKNTGKYAKINKYLDIIGVVLVVALIVITCIYWIKAPDIVPIHFNFKGEIDSYGSKNTLFILLPIAIIIYIGLAILSKYPEVCNYCIEITPRNKEKQYSMASTFIRIMNVEILTLVLFIQISIAISMNNGKSISIVFLPIALFILFGSVGFYIYKSVKFK